jgi:thioredoxin reductase
MTYDVIVIGGGAAGLSGALALARSRRRVLVVDDGTPRNAPAAAVHNYLAHDGTPPAELLARGRAEVEGYGAEVRDGRVTAVERTATGFTATLADGTRADARRLLVATGLVDELPDVEGLAQRWGRDVLHCPYCHGWEVRDQRIGVLATGPMTVHQAQLFRQLSDRVTVFRHTAGDVTDEERAGLAARGIEVVEGEVVAVVVTDDRLTGVLLRDGRVVGVDAVTVGLRVTARSAVLDALGLAAEEFVVGTASIGTAVPADARGVTAVPGVRVAGNVTDPAATVPVAAAAGLMAGAQINADLVAEDVRRAVAARHDLVVAP